MIFGNGTRPRTFGQGKPILVEYPDLELLVFQSGTKDTLELELMMVRLYIKIFGNGTRQLMNGLRKTTLEETHVVELSVFQSGIKES